MKANKQLLNIKAIVYVLLMVSTVLLMSAHYVLPWQRQPKPSEQQVYLQQLLNTMSPPNVARPAGLKVTIKPAIESVLKTDVFNRMVSSKSKWSTAIMMNINTGAIVGLTSLANPNKSICLSFERCAQPMQDAAIEPWEPGSDMKPLLLAAAINKGSLTPTSRYFDPGYAYIDGRKFIDADYYPPQVMSMQQVLSYSLNTGAIHIFKSLDGGTLNLEGRQTWYNYLINHYHFGSKTGIGLYNEASGMIRPPSGGRNIQIQYASSAFGVGEAITPIQLVAAYASLVNGGTYYAPTLRPGQVKIVSQNVISKEVSSEIIAMLHQTLVYNEPQTLTAGYTEGAKTGTAPVPSENGSYKIDSSDGTYIGYIGKTKPQYILLIRFDEPQTKGFASEVARQLWPEITTQLIKDKLI